MTKIKLLPSLAFLSLLLLFSCKQDLPIQTTELPVPDGHYGGPESDIANGGLATADGFYMIGTTQSFGQGGDILLVKASKEGVPLWHKSYGGAAAEWGVRMVEHGDGCLLLLGTTNSGNSGGDDFYLVKTTKGGDVIWEKSYGTAANDFAYELLEAKDGGYLLTGETEAAGSKDILLIKIDANGTEEWQKTYGGPDLDGGMSLALRNENILLLAYTYSYGAADRNYLLMELTATGDSLESRLFGGDGYEEPQMIRQTVDGGYILCGHTSTVDPHHNMWGVKLNMNLQIEWQREFGGMMHDGGLAVVEGAGGNEFVFVGRSNSFGAQDEDMIIAKTTASGRVLDERVSGGPGLDRANFVLEMPDAYWVIGQSQHHSHGSDDFYWLRLEK